MSWKKYFSIEVPLFMCMLTKVLKGSLMLNLNIYRTCYVILGYNETDCAMLGREGNEATSYLEGLIQPTITKMQMVADVFTIASPFCCIYVGIWSDKFGRKPFLLISLGGLTVGLIMYTVLMFFHQVNPWWFLLCNVPMLLLGDATTLLVIIIAYIADVTNESDRMFRMIIVHLVFTAASFSGSFITPYILYGTSYEFTFCFMTVCLIFALLYSYYFIEESLPHKKKELTIGNILKHLNLLDIIYCVLQKRPSNGRMHVLLNIAVTVLIAFIGGELLVFGLFLRYKLQWTLTKISMVNSLSNIFNVLATMLSTYLLQKKLKTKGLSITLFSCVGNAFGSLLRALATNDYYIYVTSLFGMFITISNIMLKTQLTFMVSPEETGKVMALSDITMSLINTLSAFVYPLLYKNTITIDPGIYNYLSCGVYLLASVLLTFQFRSEIPMYIPPNDATEKKNSKINNCTNEDENTTEECKTKLYCHDPSEKETINVKMINICIKSDEEKQT